MIGRAETRYKRSRNAFVGGPSHRSTVEDVFVGEIVRRKCLCRPDICICQTRVIRKDCLNRHSGAKFSQNHFYRNARTSNNGLAVHDLRICFNALVGMARSLVPI